MKPAILTVLSLLLLLPAAVCRAADYPGEVLYERCEVIVSSPTEMRCHVNRKILVNSSSGKELGLFLEYTDSFSSISAFSGTVESGGKVIRKIKKGDIYTENCSEGLAEDTYANAYVPDMTLFPYTVEYDYTVEYRKGIISFPAYSPVIAFDTPVKEGSYTITVPKDMEIQYKAWAEPEVTTNQKTTEYKWTLTDFQPIKKEHNMRLLSEYLPVVKARPTAFKYLGTQGSQADWNSVGKWINDIMPEDNALPEDLKATVHELTDGCASDIAKLRALYTYLKQKTRYVSIQFGLGGFSPAAPSVVYRKGYGDCKALSYFMKGMLAEAGINSEYFTLNTDRSLTESNPGVGTMNHAMLMVPLQEDTVWVECTNPNVPLGYRHEDVAGKRVLLVKPDGGELVKVPAYSDTLTLSTVDYKVTLQPDGSAQVSVHELHRLSDTESYISFSELKNEDAVSRLSKYYAVQTDDKKVLSVTDNFDDYSGVPGYIPEVSIDWSFLSRKYGSVNADMILMPVVLTNSRFPSQKSARVHDLVFSTPHKEKNTLSISIPEGYSVEFLPSPVLFDTEFACYALDYAVDGNCITVTESLKINRCVMPAADYDKYRTFVKSCNKAVQAKIVLKKNE